jgi:hypothetical protein
MPEAQEQRGPNRQPGQVYACIGFGEKTGKCLNYANGKRANPYWCDSCDETRCEHITKQMEDIAAGFDRDR